MSRQKAIDILNRFAAQMGLSPRRTKHTYVWWRNPRKWKGTTYRFGYTPWRTEFEGKTGFWAFKYRQFKNGNLKLVKAVRFARRKVARERSWQWYEKHYRAN